MHSTQAHAAGARELRVRDQARETLAVMVFSASASGVVALALLALMTWGK